MVQYLNSRLLSAKALAALRCLRWIRDCASSASIAMGFAWSGMGRAAPRPRPLPRPRVGAGDLSLIVSLCCAGMTRCLRSSLSTECPNQRALVPSAREACGRMDFFVVC